MQSSVILRATLVCKRQKLAANKSESTSRWEDLIKKIDTTDCSIGVTAFRPDFTDRSEGHANIVATVDRMTSID